MLDNDRNLLHMASVQKVNFPHVLLRNITDLFGCSDEMVCHSFHGLFCNLFCDIVILYIM